MLYGGTCLKPDEFKKMFDHKLYEQIRDRLKCESNFPDVYDKVNRKVRT